MLDLHIEDNLIPDHFRLFLDVSRIERIDALERRRSTLPKEVGDGVKVLPCLAV